MFYYSTHGFICMHFYRRDNFIAELQIGTRSSRLEDACAFNHFDSSVLPYITIVCKYNWNKPSIFFINFYVMIMF